MYHLPITVYITSISNSINGGLYSGQRARLTIARSGFESRWPVRFFAVFCGQKIHLTAKVSEEVNRKCHPRNTTVQLFTATPTMSATMHSVTDGRTDRQTDRLHYDANSRSYCLQAKNLRQCLTVHLINELVRDRHWRQQLWDTGARACPSTPNCLIVLVTSEPHKQTLDIGRPLGKRRYRPIAFH